MDLIIRKASRDDLERIKEIARRTIDANYRSFLGDEGVDSFLGSGASDQYLSENIGNCRVLLLQSRILGFSVCKDAVVDLLMIDDSFHRRGYGSRLLNDCEKVLGEQFDEIMLESFEGNDKANCFYRKNGWMEKERTFDEASGSNKITLCKKLKRDVVLPGTEDLTGKRCFCSWSGGKDSCLALYRALKAGAEVEVLVNMLVEDGERSRSHGLRTEVIREQARAMGLRLETVATSWEDYEENFVAILKKLKGKGLEAGIFGDIDLQAHLDWERKVCDRAGLKAALPLWMEGRVDMVREFLEAGFETRIVSLRAESLPPDFLGQVFSMDMAEDFRSRGIDPCGENGEFHTVVTDGPCFRRPVELIPGERVLRSGYWFLDFEVRPAAPVPEGRDRS